MTLHVATFSALAIACIAFTSPGFAQSRPFEFIAAQAPTEHNVRNLIGIAVTNETGEVIGKVNYLLVDDKGQIKTATIGVGGLLGVGEKNVGVPFAALTFVDDGKGAQNARLSASKQLLEAAPKFQWLETPMAVRVEETIKTAADTVQSTAQDIGKKAGEVIKDQTKTVPAN